MKKERARITFTVRCVILSANLAVRDEASLHRILSANWLSEDGVTSLEWGRGAILSTCGTHRGLMCNRFLLQKAG